jgi:hypothetical protein
MLNFSATEPDSAGPVRYRRSSEIVRRNLGIALLLLVFLALVPGIAAADTAPSDLLLTTQDLPEGFVLQDEAALPPTDRVLAMLSCADNQRFLGATVERRTWSNGSVAVTNMAARTVSDNAAAALLQRLIHCTSLSPVFVVERAPGAVGRVGDTVVQGTPFDVHEVVFRRDSWVFILVTSQPRPASDGLIQVLSAAQAARAPAGRSEPAPDRPADDARQAGFIFGTAFAVLLFYPEMADGLAARIQRRGRRMVVRSQSVRPDQIIDVGPRAQTAHLHALGLFTLELGILVTAVSETRSFSPVRGGVTLVLAAGGLVLLRWLRRRSAAGHSAARLRRSIGVMVLVVVAVGVGVTGLALVLAGAAMGSLGDDSVELETGVPNLSTLMWMIGLVVLGVSVALHRFARRISMFWASLAVLGDQRPPILYLRSFADDRLRLRVAPLVRPSLLERLSSRRKQGFEEVMAEELQQYGPLSAVGEPGRKLAPIGFAREHLPDIDWQSGVQQRMYQSGVIVVTVGRSRGLEWEIQELISTGSWRKVIFVFPPVNAMGILERWEALAPLLHRVGLRGVGLPADSSCLLAMTFTADAECRYYCAKYPNAWSYKAAMAVALADLAEVARHRTDGSADQHSQQR